MIVALSGATTITVSVVGLFAFLALIALVRSVMGRPESGWRRYRLGVYIERDAKDEPRSPEKIN